MLRRRWLNRGTRLDTDLAPVEVGLLSLLTFKTLALRNSKGTGACSSAGEQSDSQVERQLW